MGCAADASASSECARPYMPHSPRVDVWECGSVDLCRVGMFGRHGCRNHLTTHAHDASAKAEAHAFTLRSRPTPPPHLQVVYEHVGIQAVARVGGVDAVGLVKPRRCDVICAEVVDPRAAASGQQRVQHGARRQELR
eukprot:361471-Chlamydomonas_euryale.AAC.1